MPAIYKIKKKGYLLHADRKSTTGLRLAWQPFIQIHESDFTNEAIVNAIKEVIRESANDELVANPKNWSEHSKQFFKSMGLRSPKELYAETTKYCYIGTENDCISFTPTKLDGNGFINKSKDEINIIISFSASNQDFVAALELAFSKCE